MSFDMKRLIDDMGGPRAFAKLLGKSRTTSYRYLSQGWISTRELEAVKQVYPRLNINKYFKAVAGKEDGKQS